LTVPTVVREFEADLMICHSEAVADGVVALTLTRPDGADLPGWTPGAHIDPASPTPSRRWTLSRPTTDGGSVTTSRCRPAALTG
jgi:ferredoxin-NADP reductase